MLKNLLKTWAALAPDEVTDDSLLYDFFVFGEDTEFQLTYSIAGLDKYFYGRSCLQGYLQRCIQARGWVSNLRIFPDGHGMARVWIDDEDETDFNQSSRLPLEALLTAYLTALAAQRPVKTGQWQHFKGGAVEVKSTATWTTTKFLTFLGDNAFIEESPDETVQVHLSINDIDYQRWGYRANKDYGERVIYREQDGNRWARTTESFLGLVDAKHPEHEGLLRFVEVSSASPQ